MADKTEYVWMVDSNWEGVPRIVRYNLIKYHEKTGRVTLTNQGKTLVFHCVTGTHRLFFKEKEAIEHWQLSISREINHHNSMVKKLEALKLTPPVIKDNSPTWDEQHGL